MVLARGHMLIFVVTLVLALVALDVIAVIREGQDQS